MALEFWRTNMMMTLHDVACSKKKNTVVSFVDGQAEAF